MTRSNSSPMMVFSSGSSQVLKDLGQTWTKEIGLVSATKISLADFRGSKAILTSNVRMFRETLPFRGVKARTAERIFRPVLTMGDQISMEWVEETAKL